MLRGIEASQQLFIHLKKNNIFSALPMLDSPLKMSALEFHTVKFTESTFVLGNWCGIGNRYLQIA